MVRDTRGRVQQELFHHLRGDEVDTVKGELTNLTVWSAQCRAGKPVTKAIIFNDYYLNRGECRKGERPREEEKLAHRK